MTARLAGPDKLADPALLRVMSSALGARGEPNASLYMSKAATAIEALLARNAALESALTQCRDQFQFYANEHSAAGKTEKAATNQRFADLACDALTLNKDTPNAEG